MSLVNYRNNEYFRAGGDCAIQFVVVFSRFSINIEKTHYYESINSPENGIK